MVTFLCCLIIKPLPGLCVPARNKTWASSLFVSVLSVFLLTSSEDIFLVLPLTVIHKCDHRKEVQELIKL